MSGVATRKIIHVDMDAFFASVEQRDDPALRGRPVAVGHAAARGVVAAASYEARRFGVRSAMPSTTAQRKCPDLVFVPPRFEVYRAVSTQIHAIFSDYTHLIEPLSLDEAYLDVTSDRRGLGTASATAEAIRGRILEETGLTASAGISYNKFLAKLASDQRKPNGQFVVAPGRGEAFVEALPVQRFHGVGPVTAAKMAPGAAVSNIGFTPANQTTTYTKAEVDSLLVSATPAGTVIHVAMNTAPTGYLKANGALVSRTTYAALFTAIGTTFGVGDGSTTFALPDLRGEFIRGWADGRAVDTGRVFGSAQTDDNKSHTHTGTTDAAGSHAHTGVANSGVTVLSQDGSTYGVSGTTTTSTAPNHTHTFTTAANGGTETRPRNIALLACIKF